MLAKADGVDADLVGQNTFLDHVADDFGMRFEAAVGVGSDVAEGVEAEFDLLSHVFLTSLPEGFGFVIDRFAGIAGGRWLTYPSSTGTARLCANITE